MERLSKVILTGDAQSVTLNVGSPRPRDTYILSNITGLGSPPIDVHMTSLPTGGAVYSGNRIGSRDIIMTIQLYPDYDSNKSPLTLREEFLFTTSSTVKATRLEFVILDEDETKTRHLYVEGHLVSVESNVYSNRPEIVVTFRCPQATFKDTWQHEFWITNNQQAINVNGGWWIVYDHYYSGTVPVGFEMHIQKRLSDSYKFLAMPKLDGGKSSREYVQSNQDIFRSNNKGGRGFKLTSLDDVIPNKTAPIFINTVPNNVNAYAVVNLKVQPLYHKIVDQYGGWPVVYPGNNILLFGGTQRNSIVLDPNEVKFTYTREFLSI